MATTRVEARLASTTKGDPASGVCCIVDAPLKECGADEVEVQMAYAAINPSDVNVCEGTYLVKPPSLPAVPGFEGSGVVKSIGADVTNVAVGDHIICGWGWGSWCSVAVIPAAGCRKVAPSIDLKLAAMLAVNPITAYGLLFDAKPGDWIIQNAGNSGMGVSIIAVAKARGIKTVSIVRRGGLEADLLARGADAVVVYAGERNETQAETFLAAAAAVKEKTGGAKIKIALNAVCGLSGELLAKCLAPMGKILTYGVMSREPMSVSGGQLLFKGISYLGWHMHGFNASITEEEKETMWEWVLKAAADGSLSSPPIDSVHPLADVKAAVARAFESRRNGKVLLQLSAVN